MIDPNFVYLGLVIAVAGSISYLIDTIKGKVQPHKVSYFMWSLAPLIAFAAQFQQGVGPEALFTLVVGLCPLAIFFASFLNKKSSWEITKFDLLCGSLSVIGLILWLITQEGNIAIIFSILADLLAAIPTLIKSYTHPDSENYWGYLSSGISAFITLLTIKVWAFENYSFSLYIFLICAVIFALIRFRLGEKISKILASK